LGREWEIVRGIESDGWREGEVVVGEEGWSGCGGEGGLGEGEEGGWREGQGGGRKEKRKEGERNTTCAYMYMHKATYRHTHTLTHGMCCHGHKSRYLPSVCSEMNF